MTRNFVKSFGKLADNAFGRVGFKENLDRLKDQLDIEQDRILLDIDQVKDQLIARGGVILALDLSQTGQTGFDLQAVLELRKDFDIFFGDLDLLGTRANDRHIPFEDVDKLRKLVHTGLAQELSDLGDSVVILRSEPLVVLIRVYDHRPELEHFKGLSILGDTGLTEENRAVILQFDGKRFDQHDRACDQEAYAGNEDVHRSLDQTLLKGQSRYSRFQNDRIVDDGLMGIAGDNIGKFGRQIGRPVMLVAVLQDVRLFRFAESVKENGVMRTDRFMKGLLVSRVNIQHLTDLILLFVLGDLPDQLRQSFAVPIDKETFCRRVYGEVKIVSEVAEKVDRNDL